MNSYRYNNKNYFNNIDECIKRLDNKLNITQNNLLGKGGQGLVYKIESKECGIFAIKLFNKKNNNKIKEKELFFMKKLKKIIDDNISPNFIYMFNYKNNMIMMEYADGTLDDFLKEMIHSDEIWQNIIFQILTSILVLQKILNIYHSDIKPKNILYKKIDTSKVKYFKYIINDQVYYLPNCGYLILIGDFGLAEIINTNKYGNMYTNMSIDDIQHAIDYNYDFIHISTLYNRLVVDNLINIYENLDNFIEKNSLKNNKNLNKYIEKTITKINIKFINYNNNVKNKMILREILYYCVENNIINWANDIQYFKIYLPSENIKNMIDKIFNSKESIELLLNNNFDNYKNIDINRILKNSNYTTFDIQFKNKYNLLTRFNHDKVINYIKKIYNIDKYQKINNNITQYYYLNSNINYQPKSLSPMYNDIKSYDYIEPIKRLYNKQNNNYYKQLIENIKYKDNTRLDLNKNNIDLDEIMLQYIKCKPNCFVITLWPLLYDYSDKLIKYLETYGNVYYYKEIELSDRGMINYICSIYDEFRRNDILKIAQEKLEYIKNNKNKNNKNKISIIIFDNIKNLNISGQGSFFKKQIRNYSIELLKKDNYKDIENIRGNDLIHINDFFYQTIEYCQLLLNNNSINLLENRLYENINTSFYDIGFLKTETYRSCMYKYIDLETINSLLLIGGIGLYFHGLRSCGDIDGICFSNKNNNEIIRLFSDKKTRIHYIDFGIKNTKYWNDNWNQGDDLLLDYFKIKSFEEICYNPRYHYYYKGIKTYLLEYEIYRKIQRISKKINDKKYLTLSKDYADFIIMLKLNKNIMNNFFIKLDKNVLKINDSMIKLYPNLNNLLINKEIVDKILYFLNKNYSNKLVSDINKDKIYKYFDL